MKSQFGVLCFCLVYTIPLFLFLLHLCLYHLWLRCNHKSTYEHIVEIRERKKVQEQLNKSSNTKTKTDEINQKFNSIFDSNSEVSEAKTEEKAKSMWRSIFQQSVSKDNQRSIYLIGPIIPTSVRGSLESVDTENLIEKE